MADNENINQEFPEGEEKKEESQGMNFLDHIDEMRRRIIYAVIAIALACGGVGLYIETIMNYVLLFPANEVGLSLQNLRPFGIPFLYFKVILVCGIIIAFPFILYQFWKFISPGLYENEKSWARSITLFTSLCFLGGVAFAYFVMIPSMLNFAATFGNENIRNDIDVNEYFSFITMILLAAGILFEMPMVSYVLSKVGIVTPKLLRKYWRHAIVVILILAAVLTPTPDPISQMIFAFPLLGLYELSIFISKLTYKKEEEF